MNNVVIERQIESPEIKQIIENITYALQEIDENKTKYKANKGMIDEILKNNPAYSALKETDDENKLALKEAKEKALSTSEAAEYLNIQDEYKQKIQDLQDSLSPALEVLYQKTKLTYFTDANGKTRHIRKRFSIAPGQQELF